MADKLFLDQQQEFGLAFYLIKDNLLDRETAISAKRKADQCSKSFTQYLVETKLLSAEKIFNCCIKYFDLPAYDLKTYVPNTLISSTVPSFLIHRYHVLPIKKENDFLHIGITDPTDAHALAAITFQTSMRLRPMLVNEEELNSIINAYIRPNILYAEFNRSLINIMSSSEQSSSLLKIKEEEEPIIAFVDELIKNAISKRISDIHLEPSSKTCRIRFRRDGILFEIASLPTHLANRISTRLKILGNLNIAEKRLPQDGRITYASTDILDIRISSCPTLHGEKIVLRIFNAMHANFNIDTLGLNVIQKDQFLKKLTAPQGLILVTGPTGSGKTITLYSALQFLNQVEKNIATVEDPVEIEFTGINQVNINPKIGLDFPTILRALLRQDPDIIMIGEIRDLETARIAIHAAQTGHLVLATLHANSSVETFIRLEGMGIQLSNCIHSFSLIIAQRLLRKLCDYCKKVTSVPQHLKSQNFPIYEAVGCKLCCEGYEGRIAIFELLPVTEKIIQLVLSNKHNNDLITHLQKIGNQFLEDCGWEKVREGITSIAELTRTIHLA